MANVDVRGRNKRDNQKFEITSLEDGCYSIVAVHSGKFLAVENERK